MRTSRTHRAIVIGATVLLAVGCVVSSRNDLDARIPTVVLAVDTSTSTSDRLADVRDDAHDRLVDAYGAVGGVGSRVTLMVFGGGPGDTHSQDFDELCLASARACADEKAVRKRAAGAQAALDRLIAEPSTVGGSDPIGFFFRALSEIKARAVHGAVRVDVWTDMASRSDTLDLGGAGVDLSTPEARATIVAGLRARGLDFSSLALGAAATITIHLVPTDVTTASTVYGRQLAAFVEDLLGPTGAHIVVTWLTHHTASS